jgi:hypothetical protein
MSLRVEDEELPEFAGQRMPESKAFGCRDLTKWHPTISSVIVLMKELEQAVPCVTVYLSRAIMSNYERANEE